MTKLDYLIDALKQKIVSGIYQAGGKLPSEAQLAEEFHVNKMTVNKAVTVLARMGLLERASSCRGGTRIQHMTSSIHGMLACIMPMKHPFFHQISLGAADAAFRANYALHAADPSMSDLEPFLSKLKISGFKGILTSNYGVLQTSMPVVYVDTEHLDNKDKYTVMNDNRKGGEEMAKWLLRQGHRNMLYYSGVYGLRTPDRLHGFSSWLGKHGHSMNGRVYFNCSTTIRSIAEILKKMLKEFPGFTSISCTSDDDALRIINAAKLIDLKVPDDFIVTGYGNVDAIQSFCHIPTIEQHPFDVGARASEKIISLIESSDAERRKIPYCDLIDVELKT